MKTIRREEFGRHAKHRVAVSASLRLSQTAYQFVCGNCDVSDEDAAKLVATGKYHIVGEPPVQPSAQPSAHPLEAPVDIALPTEPQLELAPAATEPAPALPEPAPDPIGQQPHAAPERRRSKRHQQSDS